MKLSELAAGAIAEVTNLGEDREFNLKMNSMGIHPQDKIRLLRAGPFGGPLLIEELNYGGKIMVAKGLAQRIEVTRDDQDEEGW